VFRLPRCTENGCTFPSSSKGIQEQRSKIKENNTAAMLLGIKKALCLGNFRRSKIPIDSANIGSIFEMCKKKARKFFRACQFFKKKSYSSL
jgi:hypothetical protein